MFSALNQQDMLCRIFGRCRFGASLNGEVETLMLSDEQEKAEQVPKLFTYMRYNADLTRDGLASLGLPNIDPSSVQKLDSIEHMDSLMQVGVAVGRDQVRAEQFDGFPAQVNNPQAATST